jgi:CHAD domain-containing protein
MITKPRPRTRPATGDSARLLILDALADARDALERPSKSNAVRIHDFRRAVKRLRALLRLIPPPLDEAARQLRNHARDLARDLGRSRDAQSALDAVEDLVEKKGRVGLSKRTIQSISDRLAARRQSAERIQLTPQTKSDLLAWIASADAALRSWPMDAPETPIIDAIVSTYRRARRDWPRKWAAATPEEIHEFRQRIVVHRFQLELIEPLNPKLVRKWIAAAQRLRAQLGRHQDLDVLQRLCAAGQPLAPWQRRLAPLIDRRQRDHLGSAERSAERILAASPKSFRKKIEAMMTPTPHPRRRAN